MSKRDYSTNTMRKDNQPTVRPMFSLDFSLSPSSKGEQEDGLVVNVPNRGTTAFGSIDTAGRLVQKLLDQVTLNDSPPNNETGHTGPSKLEIQSQEWSPQCHVQTNMEAAISQHQYPVYSKRVNVVGQGHVGLATMCADTLQKIGQMDDSCLMDDQNENLNEQNSGKIASSEAKPHKGRFWQKTIRKATKTDDDISPNPNQDQNSTANPLTRLQLFGSEYARYLSTTPLAPEDMVHQNKPKRHQRPSLRRKSVKSVQNIEDAEKSVLTGPITDIIVTQGEDAPPKGYYKLSQSASGETFLLKDRKSTLHICVKKETNWDRAAQRPCVTALVIIFPQRKEFVPPGYSVVRKYHTDRGADRDPANLNVGGDEVAYICFRRSREGNPITGIVPLCPSRKEIIPEGYTVIERTPRNFVAHFSVENAPVFLAYRQRLANLELLRPLPLVMSVYNGGSVNRKLNAYYCTGGTVVESRIGRFHIFDRSTHSLLSPSSIKNRLSLIEAARRKAVNAAKDSEDSVGEKYSYSGSASVRSTPSSDILSSSLFLVHSLGTPCSHSAVSESDRQSSVADFESTASSEVNQSMNCSLDTSNGAMGAEILNLSIASWLNPSLGVHGGRDLQRCIDAMNFIPTISSGLGENDVDGAIAFQSRVAVLTPVLTACYARHGGAALIAVEGLKDLLSEDFFADDVNMSQLSSTQTTLLDISVQVVCDVATSGSQETHLYACVEFVERAMKYGCGYLSTRTLGYVLRFYLFVFYFGMSSPTSNWGVLKASDKYILEDPRTTSANSMLPGGAPQGAILALKDLFILLVARLGSLAYLDQCLVKREKEATRRNEFGPLQIFGLVDKMVTEMVVGSVHRVDIANITQLALHQISRSGGSELFWYEMINSCGDGLFGSDAVLRAETRHLFAMCFSLLANCVKVASSHIRKNKICRGVPRDTASKLMSLEMIKFFLDTWERGPARQEIEGSHSVSTFAFCVRRLVVPCLLTNTSECLDDPRVFRRTIQIVGTLWRSSHYRKHMKLEIGVLFDHFALRLLRLGPQILFRSSDDQDMTYLFAQQLELMKEVKSWFHDETALIELFLNFDTEDGNHYFGGGEELLLQMEWNIGQRLCSSLCHLTDRATEFLGEKIRESQSTAPVDSIMKGNGDQNQGYEGVSTVTLARESARRLRQGAVDAVTQVAQQLALAAAAGSSFHQALAIVTGWKNKEMLDWERLNLSHFAESGTIDIEEERHATEARDDENVSSRTGTSSVLDYWQRLGAIKQRFADSKVHRDAEEIVTVYSDSADTSSERKQALSIAFGIAGDRGLSKAIDYLIACNVLSASPRDIASFLRIHSKELSPLALGKYLGEGGADLAETEYWNLIRFTFIRAISFVGMTVEEGLRHLLTKGGFRLPGEAQQIDRIISTFAQCYWEDNAGDSTACPFKNQDTIFVLSFAVIMLNTDLHKSGIQTTANKKRFKTKMSKVDFINNLKGVGSGCEIDPEYLSRVYDQIEAEPILIQEDSALGDDISVTSENIQTSIASLVDNAKSMDAFLRGLSTQEYQFISLATHACNTKQTLSKACKDLTRKFMEKTWHEFHGMINSALEVAYLDPKALESCVDLLKFSLCLTILLDMPVEQVAFLDQLGRLKLFDAWRKGKNEESVSKDQESYKGEDWYTRMESNAKFSSKNGQMESLVLLDTVVESLGIDHGSDTSARKTIRDAVRQLENAEFLLNDPNRTFVRQGDLLKRANRSGRCVQYRFFLFSDVLIYAKRVSASQKFRIHEELPLILMKVVDWFPPEMKKEAKMGIQFYHPRKKFLVFCSSQDERKSWVADIRKSINHELERKVAIEGARKAATNVPSSSAN